MTIYRDYTGLVSWATTPAPPVIDDNVDTTPEGFPVTLTPSITSGEINSTHGVRFTWDLGDSDNETGSQTYVYSTTNISSAVKEISFSKASNVATDPNPQRRTISLQITGSNHTSAPFSTLSSGGNPTELIAIWNDVRALYFGQFKTPSISYTGSGVRKGFVFTDYEGKDRGEVEFFDNSENADTWGWSFGDFGTSNLQNPTYSYSTTGIFDVSVTAVGTMTDSSGILSNRTDSDTETKTSYIEVQTNPTGTAQVGVASQQLGITGVNNFGTPKLCSGHTPPSDATYIATSSVDRLTSTSIVTTKHSDFVNKFPSNGNLNGSVFALIDNASDSSLTFDITSQTGTNGSLIIDDDIDASDPSSPDNNTVPEKFFRYFKAHIEKTLSDGVHTFKLQHLHGTVSGPVGQTTSLITEFVVDSATTPPTVSFSSVTVNTLGSAKYASGLPYFNSGGSVDVNSVQINNLSTQVYSDNNPIIVNNRSGSSLVGSTQTKGYSDLSGVTRPLPINNSPTVSSIQVSLSPSGRKLTGGLSVSAQNHNGEGGSTASVENIMYWVSGGMTEDNIAGVTQTSGWGASVGGRNSIKRMSGFASGLTPSYTPGSFYDNNVWDAQNDVVGNDDVVLVLGDSFNHDSTNWTQYLPGGTSNPNRSSATGTQYLTVAFSRTGIQKFKVNITGTFTAFRVAAPTASDGSLTFEQSASSTNGWLDALSDYPGSGIPGTGAGTNFSLGVRDSAQGGASGGSGGSYFINLGTASMANATTSDKNILLRFSLTSGQSISSIGVEGY